MEVSQTCLSTIKMLVRKETLLELAQKTAKEEVVETWIKTNLILFSNLLLHFC